MLSAQLATIVVAVVLLCSCNGQQQAKSPPHYNFNKPERIRLPDDLMEISGLAYYANDKSIIAESDEQPYIFKIPLDKPNNIKRWKLDRKRDHEDIVLLDSTLYLLNSNGNLFAMQFTTDSVSMTKYEFPWQGKNEFEALYYDPELKQLVIICKECEEEVKTNNTVYAFDPAQAMYSKLFVIDGSKALEASTTSASKFKPSGAAIHPITGELYILSSVNKELVVADRGGKIKEVYQLSPKTFYHPEGITFEPNGGLYISNEAEDPLPADILYFEYKKEAAGSKKGEKESKKEKKESKKDEKDSGGEESKKDQKESKGSKETKE
ncbi:MAG: SdiA-regulated domain-containing protein [Bacteroidota bacterium]